MVEVLLNKEDFCIQPLFLMKLCTYVSILLQAFKDDRGSFTRFFLSIENYIKLCVLQ
mgnify:FL=1